PWEKPHSATRSAGNPARASVSTAESSTRSDRLSAGSLRSAGSRNDSGYHVLPSASGAKNRTGTGPNRRAVSSMYDGSCPRRLKGSEDAVTVEQRVAVATAGTK